MYRNPERIRVAVIGAGVMGGHHLRIYNSLKGVDLVGVVESDHASAREAQDRYGCEIMGGIEDLIGKVDAVSVCTPSVTHAEIGKFFLENAIPCLIEKPLAVTENECNDLIAAAARKGVILMVGHVERFNPAVRQLEAILQDGHAVHAVDARRLSSVSGRITDVDVVSDLMVHDIDIVLSLVKSPVSQVMARGVYTSGNPGGDYVSALLTFEHGGLATLTASRITQNKVRELNVTTDLGLIKVNYTTQELMVFRQGEFSEQRLAGGLSNYHLDISMERALIRNAEPLVLELQHFVDCVRQRSQPIVTGNDALEALRIVWKVQENYLMGAEDA